MKVIDIIFALVFGRIIGFLVGDFLRAWEINISLLWSLVIWLLLPLVSLCCLYVAYLIGRKLLFVYQSAKFLLVGAAATVVDLKIFELLAWFFALYIPLSSIFAKSISFIIATFLKYWGNKHWAFQKHEKEDIYKEIIQFFLITLVGLVLDVVAFYYFTKVMGPQFQIPIAVWVKFSVIFAGLVAAVWNFLGYKYLVFKR